MLSQSKLLSEFVLIVEYPQEALPIVFYREGQHLFMGLMLAMGKLHGVLEMIQEWFFWNEPILDI